MYRADYLIENHRVTCMIRSKVQLVTKDDIDSLAGFPADNGKPDYYAKGYAIKAELSIPEYLKKNRNSK